MASPDKAAYLGRFQPFCLHHASVIKKILSDFPELNLTIGIADWQGDRTQDNFLTGTESVTIAQITLADLNLNGSVQSVELRPGVTLEQSLADALIACGIIHLFSGSPKTQAAATLASQRAGYTLRIHPLIESPEQVHASQVRQSLLDGTSDWKGWVAPGVIEYLNTHLDIIQRLRSLPSSENKRPWTSEASPGT